MERARPLSGVSKARTPWMSGKMGSPGDPFWRCSSRMWKRQSVATKPLGDGE
jgi:hypothetical protein